MTNRVTLGKILKVADQRYPRQPGLRHVCPRPFWHNTGTTGVTDRTFMSRIEITQNLTRPFVAFWSNFSMGGSPEILGGSFTLEVRCFLYDGATYIGPYVVTFDGGNPSRKLGQKEVVPNDPIWFGPVQKISGNLRLRFNARIVCAAGTNVPTGSNLNGGLYADGVNNLETAGVTAGDGFTSGPTYGPCGIAMLTEDGISSGVTLIHDSNGVATGDSISTPSGWFVRFCAAAGIGCMGAPKSGETIESYSQAYNRRNGRVALACGTEDYLNALGVNDVSGTRTLAQIKADYITAWSEMADLGRRVWCATIPPRTSSPGNWTNPGDQTIVWSNARETIRQELNEWMRSGQARDDSARALFGVVDYVKGIETDNTGALNLTGGRILTTGVAKGITDDGLHFSAGGGDYIANYLNTTDTKFKDTVLEGRVPVKTWAL